MDLSRKSMTLLCVASAVDIVTFQRLPTTQSVDIHRTKKKQATAIQVQVLILPRLSFCTKYIGIEMSKLKAKTVADNPQLLAKAALVTSYTISHSCEVRTL